MTAVSPAPGAQQDQQAAATPPCSRVSLLVGDSHQIDMLLPAAVPLQALTGPTVTAINRMLRTRGEPELVADTYQFARATGMAALAPELSLASQQVKDGELLVLAAAPAAQRYEPVIESVSTALARYAAQHFALVSARAAVAVATGICGAALLIAAALMWRLRWATDGALLAPIVFAATALVLLGAAAAARRLGAPTEVGNAALWAALGCFVAAGATLPPGGQPGAPHAALAAATAIAGALALARYTGRYWAPVAAIVTVGVAALAVAVVRMFWIVPGWRIGVVLLIAVLVAITIAPAVGLKMARVPRQTFGSITGRDIFSRAPGQPADTLSPVESAPHDITLRGEEVGQVARRSNTVLTGLLTGIAATQIAASIAAVSAGSPRQWPQITVVVVVALIMLLRARAFRDRRHAILVVCGAIGAVLAIPAEYGFAAAAGDVGPALWAAAMVIGIAAAGMLAAAVVPTRVFSPPVREVVEWLEYLLLAVIVTFAAWTIDLLSFVRYH